MATSQTANEQFKRIAVKEVIPNPQNPRTIDEKSAAFRELTESVKGSGVRIPVHLRIHPKKKNKYELLAGERRIRAAKAVGRDTVPAIVHVGISDEEAFEILVTENYARDDLTPLEQSKAVANLLEHYKGDVQAAASRLGQTERRIRQLSIIHNRLSATCQKAMAKDGSPYQDWTVGHWGLVARLPESQQDDLLEDYEYYDTTPTVAQLKKKIIDLLRTLNKAPWNLDDPTLVPKAGACLECPHRSSHQPGLWDEEETEPEKTKKNDRCLNILCWREKMTAHIQRRSTEIKKEHSDLILLKNGHTNYYQDQDLQKQFGVVVSDSQYESTRKSDKKAVPALVVYGKGEGTLRWVKRRATTSGSTSARGNDGKAKPKTLKQRRELLNSKRWCQVLIELRKILVNTPLKELCYAPGGELRLGVAALVGLFGTSYRNNNLCYAVEGPTPWKSNKKFDLWKRYDAITPYDKIEQPEIEMIYETLWCGVRPVLNQRLFWSGGVTQLPKEYAEEARHVGKLIGVDVKALFKDVSERKGFTEPKSWANLKADGTPKTSKLPKKKKAKAKKKKTA